MTWHAADKPLPTGAVQTFGTLEAEPPHVRPHSPYPSTAPIQPPCCPPAHCPPKHSPALLHCIPLSVALTTALCKPSMLLLHGLERAGSFGSCSSKQGLPLLIHHPIPLSAWSHRNITSLTCTAVQLWQCAGRWCITEAQHVLQSSAWMSLASSARKILVETQSHHQANPYHLAHSDITHHCFPADGHRGR